MHRLRRFFIALLIALFVAGRAAADFTFPPQRRGATEAVLGVRVAAHSEAPGIGAAGYTVVVRGPAELEVAPPQLGDAAGVWKEDWQASLWEENDGGVTVTVLVPLRQVKPGPAALPDLRLRWREGPEAPWHEAQWLDVLRQPRDVTGPAAPPPPPAPWKWAVAGVVVASALLAALVLGRRRPPTLPPAPPEVRALKEIDRLEREALPPAESADAFHTRLSEAVRRYLAERFGLKALAQTTAEFLAAARKVAKLGEREALLREFCERCDLAKFARAGLSADDCRRSVALARSLVQQTRPSESA
jgi:hypothetical protein